MAPWGAIIRVAMQVGMTALNAVLKALPEAYAAGRQGAKGAAGAVSGANRIPITHARQVLGFSEGQAVKDLDKAMVMEAYAKLFTLNDPADGGSLYIQAKVYHAKEALLEALGVPHEERELPDDMEGEEADEPAKQGEIGKGGDEKADREERR